MSVSDNCDGSGWYSSISFAEYTYEDSVVVDCVCVCVCVCIRHMTNYKWSIKLAEKKSIGFERVMW